jgi:hypothetical protein
MSGRKHVFSARPWSVGQVASVAASRWVVLTGREVLFAGPSGLSSAVVR